MKILVDMNLSPTWVAYLATHGIEAAHWSALGSPDAPDRDILAYAERHGFIVFTHDLDFGMLLAFGKGRGPSVLQVRTHDVLPEAIGELVLQAISAAHKHLEAEPWSQWTGLKRGCACFPSNRAQIPAGVRCLRT